MRLGIDRLLTDGSLQKQLTGRRLALLAHPASMTSSFEHSVDALMGLSALGLRSAFGPQHGLQGDKQDNMIETEDALDPRHGIPVFSLYGQVRRPTEAMLATFDVLLVDLQDVGTRIYTFLTTLLYVLEAGARTGKSIWVLDRPNPAGRPVEGSALLPGWTSFVGAATGSPMRHGLTLGEFALWFKRELKLDVDLKVVAMEGYDPGQGPGFGWPSGERPWVNPSPNASSVSMARAFPGTVLLEGTHLSEGRGTTHPLEMCGAPGLDMPLILRTMRGLAPSWMEGCRLRPCFFQPTFQKHAGRICAGFQIHLDDASYDHDRFRPYRLMALLLKAIRTSDPDYAIWRDFPYEYETTRLAFDLIDGGPGLREWVDDASARPADLEARLLRDEAAWVESRREFFLYPGT